jgi:hypothetical protein
MPSLSERARTMGFPSDPVGVFQPSKCSEFDSYFLFNSMKEVRYEPYSIIFP